MMRKRSMGLVASILVLTAAFVAATLALPALAGPSGPSESSRTVQGEIVAVDNSGYMTVITVLSPQIGQFPNNEMNIFANRGTTAKVCNMREPAKNVPVDNSATIIYHEMGGVAVADSISERC